MNKYSDMAANKTYSLTVGHIERVNEMAAVTKQSQGEILRQAIDLLYQQMGLPDKQQNDFDPDKA